MAARPVELRDCLVVIAPRHPQRRSVIETELEQLGLSYAVRSQGGLIEPETEVYLADTLGEMKSLMSHARVVVMGGSFDQTGGHNLLEPASLGCAILTGPADSNVKSDIKLLADGMRQVGDTSHCWRVIASLLDNPKEVERLGKQAREQLARQPDIVKIYLHAIEPWLRHD